MGAEIYAEGPRIAIADVDNGESIEFPLHPENLEHTSEATWARHTVPGLSHQRHQFVNTNSGKFGFTVFVDTLDGRTTKDELDRIYNFLDSMQFPAEGKGASKYLLSWPGMAALVIVSASVVFTVTRWSQQDGSMRAFSAKISIEETRDLRITKDAVRRRGLMRAGGTGPAR